MCESGTAPAAVSGNESRHHEKWYSIGREPGANQSEDLPVARAPTACVSPGLVGAGTTRKRGPFARPDSFGELARREL
jgi:hypothetical protein